MFHVKHQDPAAHAKLTRLPATSPEHSERPTYARTRVRSSRARGPLRTGPTHALSTARTHQGRPAGSAPLPTGQLRILGVPDATSRKHIGEPTDRRNEPIGRHGARSALAPGALCRKRQPRCRGPHRRPRLNAADGARRWPSSGEVVGNSCSRRGQLAAAQPRACGRAMFHVTQPAGRYARRRNEATFAGRFSPPSGRSERAGAALGPVPARLSSLPAPPLKSRPRTGRGPVAEVRFDVAGATEGSSTPAVLSISVSPQRLSGRKSGALDFPHRLRSAKPRP